MSECYDDPTRYVVVKFVPKDSRWVGMVPEFLRPTFAKFDQPNWYVTLGFVIGFFTASFLIMFISACTYAQ